MLADLIHRVDEQSRVVNAVREHQESIPRIASSIVTPSVQATNPSKNSKPPNLPIFSGDVPTPRGEVEYTQWIFQVWSFRESYTDEAINPFPAVYEFILVFHSAANKYICFIFLIPSPPATNIFVETINAPAHAHNSNHHFQHLEYFQQFEIYCILWLFSMFTSVLVSIIYIFNF